MTTPPMFRLAWAGALGVPLLVIGAVAVRGPVFPDDGAASDSAEAADSSGAHTGASAPSSAGSSHGGRPIIPPLDLNPLGIAPSPGASAGNTSVGSPAEIRAALDDLQRNFRGNNITSAISSLKTLVAIDPDVIKDANDDILDLAQRSTLLKGGESADVFDLVENKMGTGGIDLLYEMVSTRGGSDMAVEAKKALDTPEILARGTPAVQVAYKLWSAVRGSGSCEATKALLPNVREYGDRRAFGELLHLGGRCGRRHAGCCLGGDADYEETLKAMQAKGYQ